MIIGGILKIELYEYPPQAKIQKGKNLIKYFLLTFEFFKKLLIIFFLDWTIKYKTD